VPTNKGGGEAGGLVITRRGTGINKGREGVAALDAGTEVAEGDEVGGALRAPLYVREVHEHTKTVKAKVGAQDMPRTRAGQEGAVHLEGPDNAEVLRNGHIGKWVHVLSNTAHVPKVGRMPVTGGGQGGVLLDDKAKAGLATPRQVVIGLGTPIRVDDIEEVRLQDEVRGGALAVARDTILANMLIALSRGGRHPGGRGSTTEVRQVLVSSDRVDKGLTLRPSGEGGQGAELTGTGRARGA